MFVQILSMMMNLFRYISVLVGTRYVFKTDSIFIESGILQTLNKICWTDTIV